MHCETKALRGFFFCPYCPRVKPYIKEYQSQMKTTYGQGVIVTSKWLNGAKEIYFDGQDLDWHYDPLGLNSLVTVGPNGLDSRYLTLGTNQPTMSQTGELIAGSPISGSKVITGKWWFGYPAVPNENSNVNPSNLPENAPRSYVTNTKYHWASGTVNPTISQKFALLDDSDLVTKKIISDQLDDLVIDNGEY